MMYVDNYGQYDDLTNDRLSRSKNYSSKSGASRSAAGFRFPSSGSPRFPSHVIHKVGCSRQPEAMSSSQALL